MGTQTVFRIGSKGFGMHSFLYKLAVRRAGVRGDQPAEQTAIESYSIRALRKHMRFRRVLLFLLIMAAIGSFIEVVLLPGTLVRRLFAGTPTSTSDSQVDEREALTPELLFMSPQERQRLDDIRKQRLETKVKKAQGMLGDAIVAAEGALRRSRNEFVNRFGAPILLNSRVLPPSVIGNILSIESTASLAWNDLSSAWVDGDELLARAATLHRLQAERFSGNTVLPEDEAELLQTTMQLNDLASRLAQTKSDCDHLSILVRGRMAFERPALAEQN
jgi:hypothetical protein